MWPVVLPKVGGHCPHHVGGRLFTLHFVPLLELFGWYWFMRPDVARDMTSGKIGVHRLVRLVGCPVGHAVVRSAPRPFRMTSIHALRRRF